MFVTALLPPGNILAALQKVKERLFSRSGYASLYALPSIIPLATTDMPPTSPPEDHRLRQTDIVTIADACAEDGAIVLRVEPSGLRTAMIEQLPPLPTPARRPVVPSVDALVLCFDEGPDTASLIETARRELQMLEEAPLRWKRGDLLCFELISTATPWWSVVELSYVWRRPLKGPPNRP